MACSRPRATARRLGPTGARGDAGPTGRDAPGFTPAPRTVTHLGPGRPVPARGGCRGPRSRRRLARPGHLRPPARRRRRSPRGAGFGPRRWRRRPPRGGCEQGVPRRGDAGGGIRRMPPVRRGPPDRRWRAHRRGVRPPRDAGAATGGPATDPPQTGHALTRRPDCPGPSSNAPVRNLRTTHPCDFRGLSAGAATPAGPPSAALPDGTGGNGVRGAEGASEWHGPKARRSGEPRRSWWAGTVARSSCRGAGPMAPGPRVATRRDPSGGRTRVPRAGGPRSVAHRGKWGARSVAGRPRRDPIRGDLVSDEMEARSEGRCLRSSAAAGRFHGGAGELVGHHDRGRGRRASRRAARASGLDGDPYPGLLPPLREARLVAVDAPERRVAPDRGFGVARVEDELGRLAAGPQLEDAGD